MKILNRTKNYYNEATKQYLRVEDSKSVVYKHRQQDFWNQRIYQEYLDCTSLGGLVIFSTFTYNDRFLPKYHFFNEKGEKDWFPRFSKEDKDRFLNSLRKRWERAGFTDNTEYKFKYIWPNEYGTSEDGTHRPHYHPLFFIPREIVDYENQVKPVFMSLEDHFKDLFRKYWSKDGESLGYVMWSPGSSIFVNSEFASLYCSKYMFKQDNLLLNEKVKEFLKLNGQLPDDGKKKGSFTSHWQSLHFGESLVNKYDNIDTYVNGLNMYLPSELKRGKVVRHQCPTYIERKILYDYNKTDNQYLLNEKGVEFKRKKFLARFESMVNRYERYFNDNLVRTFIGNFDFRDSKVLRKYGNLKNLLNFLHNVDSRIFCEEVVLYSRIWEGLLLSPAKIELLLSCNHQEFKELSLLQLEQNIAPHLHKPFSDLFCEDGVFLGIYKDGRILQRSVIGYMTAYNEPVYTNLENVNYCGRFSDVHEFLDIVEELDRIYYTRIDNLYQEEREIRKRVKLKIA